MDPFMRNDSYNSGNANPYRSQDSQDPWNWKMPSRRDTMTLNTLNEYNDLCTVKSTAGLRTRRVTSTNMIAHDIKGAAPKVEIPKQVNKQNFFGNTDIEKAKPRALHYELKKEYSSMSNNDIQGSKSQHVKFTTKRMDTNPLCPEYALSKQFETIKPEIPRFLRDGMSVQDIDGTRARAMTDRFLGDRMDNKDIDGCRPKQFTDKYLGDNMNIADIDGSRPKEFTEKYLGDRMDVKDIEGTTAKKQPQRSELHDQSYLDVSTKKEKKRASPHNPQEPKYKTRDENNNLIEIGHVKGSKATQPYYRKNQDEVKVNTVKGIAYATTGTRTKGNFKDRERRQYRQTNEVTDIYGTTALLKSQTMRKKPTNPLQPEYQVPGANQAKSKRVSGEAPGGVLGFVTSKKSRNPKGLKIVRPKTNSEYHSTAFVSSGGPKDDVKSAGKPSYTGKIPTLSSSRFDQVRESASSHYSVQSSIKSGIRPPTQLSGKLNETTQDKKMTVYSKAKQALGLDKQKSAKVDLSTSMTGRAPKKLNIFSKGKKSVPSTVPSTTDAAKN